MAKASTIELLPEDLLEELQALLRDPRVTQLETVRRINEVLYDQGHDEEISKSALNRYSLRMDKVGQRLRESREVAKMWIGRLGSEPAGQVGKLLNELIRNLAFDAALKLSEGDEPVPPKLIKELAIAVQRLERASAENEKVADLVRTRVADKAEEVVVKEYGLSADTAAQLRRKLLGVKPS